MKENIPIAETIISDEINRTVFPWIDEKPEQMEAIKHVAIKVARVYVKLALKAASENAKLMENPTYSRTFEDTVDKLSILNSYPLSNIK